MTTKRFVSLRDIKLSDFGFCETTQTDMLLTFNFILYRTLLTLSFCEYHFCQQSFGRLPVFFPIICSSNSLLSAPRSFRICHRLTGGRRLKPYFFICTRDSNPQRVTFWKKTLDILILNVCLLSPLLLRLVYILLDHNSITARGDRHFRTKPINQQRGR